MYSSQALKDKNTDTGVGLFTKHKTSGSKLKINSWAIPNLINKADLS